MRMCLGGVRTVLLVAALGAMASAGGARAQSDGVAQGHAVAARVCATCHAVEPNQTNVSADGIPALPVAMQRADIDAAWLRNFLSSPHQRMPSIALVRDEREALVAYLLSLRKR